MSSIPLETLEQAEQALHADHAKLDELLADLVAQRSRPTLVDMLRALHSALRTHFEREEVPGGYYDKMGATAGRFREQVRALADEHFRVLAFVQSLAHLAADGDITDDELVERVADLANRMREHEEHEKALADAARRSRVA